MEQTVVSEGITLVNGDCMEYMRGLPDGCVDFILADIPYELKLDGGGGCFSSRGIVGGSNAGKSSLLFVSEGIDYDKVFTEFIRVQKVVNACVFCSNKQVGKIMTWWENRGGYVPTCLVWDKPNPIPLCNGKYVSNLEFIIYIREKGATFNNLGFKMQLKTFRYAPPSAQERIHETEKPQDLLRHLLMLHTNAGDMVLDPYAGSFSTAIACHGLDRKFIGIEIDKKYYNKAVERFKRHTAQGKLF